MHFQKRAQLPESRVDGKKPSVRQMKNGPPRTKRSSRRHQVTSSSSKDTVDENRQSGYTENVSHPLQRKSDNDGRREVSTKLQRSRLRTTRHGRTRKVAVENLEGGRRRKSDIPHRSSYGERTSLASTLVSALCNLDTNRQHPHLYYVFIYLVTNYEMLSIKIKRTNKIENHIHEFLFTDSLARREEGPPLLYPSLDHKGPALGNLQLYVLLLHANLERFFALVLH